MHILNLNFIAYYAEVKEYIIFSDLVHDIQNYRELNIVNMPINKL